MTTDRVRENRVRRAARRQGYKLAKSPVRDPRGLSFGQYGLIAIETGASIFPYNCLGSPCTATLDDVELWLAGPPGQARPPRPKVK